jgi:hypothetical protein
MELAVLQGLLAPHGPSWLRLWGVEHFLTLLQRPPEVEMTSTKNKKRRMSLVPVEDRAAHEMRVESMRNHPTSHKPRPTIRIVSPFEFSE